MCADTNERKHAPFSLEPEDDEPKDVSHEYRHLYVVRLEALKHAIKTKAIQRWGEKPTQTTVAGLSPGTDCFIIATLYKQMRRKRRALDAFLRTPRTAQTEPPSPDADRFSPPEPGPVRSPSLVSADDRLFAEDATGRVPVAGVDAARWPTGLVAALRGRLGPGSVFAAEELCLAGPPPQPPRVVAKTPAAALSGGGGVVAVASGLGWAAGGFDFAALKMAADFVAGYVGPRGGSADVVRFVVAGGVFGDVMGSYEIDPMFDEECSPFDETSLKAVTDADQFLAALAASVPLTILSGPGDPTSALLPQRAMPRRLFPRSAAFDSFGLAPNPAAFEVAGARFLGCAGQNVDDVCRATSLGRLDAMELALRSRLLAPTAPDTLPALPRAHRDRLLLERCPDVYFAGGADRFERRDLCEDGRTAVLLSVPAFSKTRSIVMVRLPGLETEEVVFDAEV